MGSSPSHCSRPTPSSGPSTTTGSAGPDRSRPRSPPSPPSIWPGERTLHLACSEIGPGLFIQHGFATIVAARRSARNCWVNQQVTIGFTQKDQRPVLGDNVFVYAGAKVFGDVTIGDGATVGANAVVLGDVPPRYTAVGVPARLLPPKDEGHS